MTNPTQPADAAQQSALRELVGRYATVQTNIRALRARNDRAGAIEEARKGFAMLERHTEGLAFSLDGANNLASLLGEMGQWVEAEPLFERSAQIHEQALGTQHPDTATAYMMLGLAKLQMNKLDESERLLLAALAVRQAVLGARHPHTAIALSNIAALYDKTNRPDQARSARTLAQQILDNIRSGAPRKAAAKPQRHVLARFITWVLTKFR